LLKEAMDEYKQAIASFTPDQADQVIIRPVVYTALAKLGHALSLPLLTAQVSRADVYAALAQVLIDLGYLKEASLVYNQLLALQKDSPSTDVYHTKLAEL
jgi:hypothetical protein